MRVCRCCLVAAETKFNVCQHGDEEHLSTISNHTCVAHTGTTVYESSCALRWLRVFLGSCIRAEVQLPSVSVNGIEYATLDGTAASDSNVGCQNAYMPLPSGWVVAEC